MISSEERAAGVELEDDASVRRRNGDRRVTELMSWALLTAPVTMRCRDALALAAARGVHHIPVLDGGVMVGIVCTCDLGAPDEPLLRHLRAPVATVTANVSSREALQTMQREDVGALPVLYHGFLIGIVTLGDLVRAHVLSEHERPVCAGCGSHHHVRLGEARRDEQAICIPCRQKRGRR